MNDKHAGEEPSKKIPPEVKFFFWYIGLFLLWSLSLTVNKVVYNWVFLPKHFPNQGWFSIANLEMLTAYWNTSYGKALCIENLVLTALLAIGWRYLFRTPKDSD